MQKCGTIDQPGDFPSLAARFIAACRQIHSKLAAKFMSIITKFTNSKTNFIDMEAKMGY